MTERNLAIELRPKSFSEVLGNEKTVARLQEMIRKSRLPTAILFYGPKGVGKTTLARIFSAEIEGDLEEVNASHDTGVDAARGLGNASQYKPLYGKYKVIVLDEAHWLTKQAQNALLKHIEDASSTTIWILCTTEPGKLIDTIKDRCQAFKLSGLDANQTTILVTKAMAHLHRPPTGAHELVEQLVQNNITGPRSILNAVEAMVAGADPLDVALASEGSAQAIDIARAVSKKDFKTVASLLQKVTADDAMTIRIVVINYLKAMLLKGNTIKIADAIISLAQPITLEAGIGLAELTARLYNICNGTL